MIDDLSGKEMEKIVIEIRKEQRKDYDAIRSVNDLTFGQPEEGHIVDRLRESCEAIISLVAVADKRILGHIFFSLVTIEGSSGLIKGMGLAPMAVLPAFQNQGIGSMLVDEGLRIVREMSYPFVIVLGHEGFYPRFGFQKASKFGLKSQWQGVPDDAFMALILDESAMRDVSGIARYRDEFSEAI